MPYLRFLSPIKFFLPGAAAMLVFCLALGGCPRGGGGGGNQPGQLNANELVPENFIRGLFESRPDFASVEGEAKLRILDQSKPFRLTVNADIVAENPDRLRIVASKARGRIEAFDMAVIGDRIGVYLPRDKVYLVGAVDQLPAIGMDLAPEAMIRHILAPDRYLIRMDWREQAPPGRGRGAPGKTAILLEEVSGREVETLERYRLTIQRAPARLLKIERLDRRGNPRFIKRFDRYRNLTTANGETVLIPMTVEIVWPIERRTIRIDWERMEIDGEIDDLAFMPDVPANIEASPLGEAEFAYGDDDFGDDEDDGDFDSGFEGY